MHTWLHCLALAQEAGCLCVRGATVRRTLSFLDYMAGGCEINFMCALDFSGGNALAEDTASAHHTGVDGQAPSVYERALAALGAIMQFYDPLRSFPLWGFGGQVGHAAAPPVHWADPWHPPCTEPWPHPQALALALLASRSCPCVREEEVCLIIHIAAGHTFVKSLPEHVNEDHLQGVSTR